MCKKIVSLCLACLMIIGLIGCTKTKPTSAKKQKKKTR